MKFYQVSLALVAFINLFLGIFVLSRDVKARTNRLFCLFGSFMSFWMTALFFLSLVPQENKALARTCLLFLHLILVFLYSLYFHFVLAITKDQSPANKRFSYSAYLLSLIFFILGRMGLFDSDLVYSPLGYCPVLGPANHFFHLVFFFFFSYGNYLLYQAYRATPSPFEKNSYKYLFLGMVVTLLFALTNIARVIGFKVYPMAYVGILCFNLMTALAIVRYRLMDINLIIRPGLAYAILTAMVTAIWLSCIFLFEKTLHIPGSLARVMIIFIFIFIFNILRERIQFIVDKLFYRQRQELFSLQKKVSEEIATNYDPDLLVPYLMHQIKEALHCEFASCMLREKDIYLVKYIMGNGEENVSVSADSPLIQWLSMKKREIFYREIDDDPNFDGPRKEIKEDFEKTNTRLIVPLIHRDEIIGILSLGEKKGNGSYTYDEIGLLNTMAKELSLSLENSRLHIHLKERSKELERANAAKSDFLNVVSHELKTPLTFIIAQLGILKKETLGRLTKSQKEGIKKIEEKGFKLNSVITDILNLAAIENKKFYELKTEKVYLRKLIDEVAKAFGLLIYHKGLSIELDLPDRFPSVFSDSGKISDILYRLLDNAVKFTPSGGEITIGARETKAEIEIFVSDTGIGIAKENEGRIFERFYQQDGSITRKYSGMGLGLAITSELVKALGGKIWVSSKQGEGSTFTFTIPKN